MIDKSELIRVPAFADLPDDQIAWFLSQSQETHVKAGETYVRQGDPADWMFVILEGQFQWRGEFGGETVVLSAKVGDVTGVAEKTVTVGTDTIYKLTATNDGGSVTVSAVEDNVSAGRLFGAGPGQKYVAAEVKGCSGPHEKSLTFDPSYFMLKLDDGTMRDHGPAAKKPELEGGTVPAGKCLSGWVTFTVPDGAVATAVLYDGSSRLTWTVPPPKGAKPTTTTTP